MAASTDYYYQNPQAQQPQQHPNPPHARQLQSQAQAQLPSPQPRPQQQPPLSPSARSRTFSFHSHKSHKNSGSKDLTETHAEKEAKRLHTKADPTLAMSEAEPSELAQMAGSTLASLRAMQHKDINGNPIADPDKSNPTRSRWERPLDTIRSFEAAIDGGYARKSVYRSDSESITPPANRRSSFFGGPQQPRFQHDSYYSNGRPMSTRPEPSQYDMPRNSQYDSYGGPYGGVPRQRILRQQTEPQYQVYGRAQNIYPLPHKDRSYETVTSAAGSGNSEAAGYQTDLTSSDNSSIDRTSPPKRLEPINDYGIGFSQSQYYQPQNFQVRKNVPQQAAAPPAQAPAPQQNPAVPRKDKPTLLKRVSTAQTVKSQNGTEKRKSWLSRRFSKNA